jgi:putative ABC transport system permease protein
MLGVMLSVGDKINRELRAVGANIVVTERAASVTGGVGGVTTVTAAGNANYIPEAQVPGIKSIFWHLNITGFAPSLFAQYNGIPIQGVWFAHPYKGPDGDTQITGMRAVNPSWNVTGRWAEDLANDCMIGEGVARRTGWKLGDTVTVLGAPFKVAGIISSGEDADDRVFLPLRRVQELTNDVGRAGASDLHELCGDDRQ